MNNVFKKIKRALGQEANKGAIPDFPAFNDMVEGFNMGRGLLYAAELTQTSTSAPTLKTSYPVYNPYTIVATLGRTSAGLYTIAFAFAGITAIDAPSLERIRCRITNHAPAKILEKVVLSISTTTVTATFRILDIANIAGASLVVADLVGDVSVELYAV